MISAKDRINKEIKITNPSHIMQVFKERGKNLFNKKLVKEMLIECWDYIQDYNSSIIIPDERKNSETKSTHIAIFLSDAGKLVAIPCEIDGTHINVLTLKNVEEDEHPNWYIKKYNQFAEEKGLKKLNLIYKSEGKF